MKKRLFIFLTATDALTCKWYVHNGETQSIDDSGEASLIQIAERNDDADIWVILPAEHIYLTELNLPKIALSKAIKAIPFALEDQIADDINNIHFALGHYDVGQPISVAVIAKSLMVDYYKQLKDAFKMQFNRIKVVTTETLLLPREPAHWTILAMDPRILIRTDTANGGYVDKNNMDIYLHELYKLTINKPEVIDLYKFDDGIDVNIDLAAIPLNKKIITDPMLFLVEHAPAECAINLLQNEFKVANLNSESLYKRMITGVLAGVIVLATVGLTLEHSILENRYTHLEDEISTLYLSIFPDSKMMLDPQLSINRELNKLRLAGSSNEFLQLTRKIAASMKTNPGIKIHSADFQNSILKIQVSTTEFNKLDRFVQDLSKQQLQVKRDNVTSAGNIIQGSLIISGASS